MCRFGFRVTNIPLCTTRWVTIQFRIPKRQTGRGMGRGEGNIKEVLKGKKTRDIMCEWSDYNEISWDFENATSLHM